MVFRWTMNGDDLHSPMAHEKQTMINWLIWLIDLNEWLIMTHSFHFIFIFISFIFISFIFINSFIHSYQLFLLEPTVIKSGVQTQYNSQCLMWLQCTF